MKTPKRGGARKGTGPKIKGPEYRKEHINLYVEQGRIDKAGDEKAIKEEIYSFLKKKYPLEND